MRLYDYEHVRIRIIIIRVAIRDDAYIMIYVVV